MLCIDRKLRSFLVECHSYHICQCSRTYILNNLIHQLHNVFLLCCTSECTDSRSNHWSGIQVTRATAARMSLKVGTAVSMRGNNGEHVTKLVAANDKRKMKKYILVNLTTWICSSAHFMSKPPQEKYISCKTQRIKHVGYRLENSRLHFQKCLCKWGWSRDWIWPQLRNHDSKWQRRSWHGFREESPSV